MDGSNGAFRLRPKFTWADCEILRLIDIDMRFFLHSVVIRTASTLGGNPGDDLVGILDVAGLAVHAIGRIQADAFAVWGG